MNYKLFEYLIVSGKFWQSLNLSCVLKKSASSLVVYPCDEHGEMRELHSLIVLQCQDVDECLKESRWMYMFHYWNSCNISNWSTLKWCRKSERKKTGVNMLLVRIYRDILFRRHFLWKKKWFIMVEYIVLIKKESSRLIGIFQYFWDKFWSDFIQ